MAIKHNANNYIVEEIQEEEDINPIQNQTTTIEGIFLAFHSYIIEETPVNNIDNLVNNWLSNN